MDIAALGCSACIEMLFTDRSPDPAARVELAWIRAHGYTGLFGMEHRP